MIYAIDFDGTVVKNQYPDIGPPVPGAEHVLRKLQQQGHQIILWTMRSGPQLEAAVQYMQDLGIHLYGVNNNPTQREWTTSPKAYAHQYIDDSALGCPLIHPPEPEWPYVNWNAIYVELFGDVMDDELKKPEPNWSIREYVFGTEQQASRMMNSIQDQVKSAKVVSLTDTDGRSGWAVLVDGHRYLRQDGSLK